MSQKPQPKPNKPPKPKKPQPHRGKPPKPKKPHPPPKQHHRQHHKTGAISKRAGFEWPLAMNDQLDTCAAAAIGSSILLQLGLWVDDDLLACTGENLTLPELFEVAKVSGIDGIILKEAWQVHERFAGTCGGLVIALELEDGEHHAALTLGRGMMASWGGAVPIEGTVTEAWWPEWSKG